MIRVDVRQQADIVEARRRGRDLAAQLGLSTVDQARLATAISELARNALQYAGGGCCEIQDCSDARTVRIEMVMRDQGPGIADLDTAMLDGYSSSGGLGAGLPGTRRLMTEFAIESSPAGTLISTALTRQRALLR